MPGQELQCERWVNFYAVTSATAATLLGLLFVVITLAAERRREDAAKINIYLTPPVIYLSSVLLMGAILTVPNQTRFTAMICNCLEGIAGLGYSGALAIRRGADTASYESRVDILPYAVPPLGAYALMVVGGVLLPRRPQIGLDLVAAGMLVLIGIGSRNSWAIATTIVSSRG
jgi:hypothetical protein